MPHTMEFYTQATNIIEIAKQRPACKIGKHTRTHFAKCATRIVVHSIVQYARHTRKQTMTAWFSLCTDCAPHCRSVTGRARGSAAFASTGQRSVSNWQVCARVWHRPLSRSCACFLSHAIMMSGTLLISPVRILFGCQLSTK